MNIPVLCGFKVTGRHADRSPVYEFRSSFPTANVQVLTGRHSEAKDAEKEDRQWAEDYMAKRWPGGSAEVCAIVRHDDGSHSAVVNSYYSNS